MNKSNEVDHKVFEPSWPQPFFSFYIKGVKEKVKIYANGWIEGWPKWLPRIQGICNHAPTLLSFEQTPRYVASLQTRLASRT